MQSFLNSKSIKPYIVFFWANIALFSLAFLLNITGLAYFYGRVAASITTQPLYILMVCLIYFVRLPYLCLVLATALAVGFFVYDIEFVRTWEIRGIDKPDYFGVNFFARIWSGALILSLLGAGTALSRRLYKNRKAKAHE